MLPPLNKVVVITITTLSLLWGTASLIFAAEQERPRGKTAIVLASFGTTVPSAVKAIAHISDQVRKAYPETEVRLSFTSNIVRKVWKKRRLAAQEWLEKGIPVEVLNVRNIIQTMGDLQEEGFRNIIIQPTHIFYMEQSYDLAAYVRGLESIKTLDARWNPFDNIVLGRPALGMPGDQYNYHKDVASVVKTLGTDAEEARQKGAILLYMGHGNEHWSTGIYGETERIMRDAYPEVATFVGVVEGFPGLDDLLPRLKHAGKRRVVLRPFMITAGDHARNDMAGPDPHSWQSILSTAGFEVEPVFEGLGSKDAFVALFIEHIADAAKERGILLR